MQIPDTTSELMIHYTRCGLVPETLPFYTTLMHVV